MNTTTKEPMPCLTGEETGRLLQAAAESGPRDHLVVALALDTGLRVCEIANLRASSLVGKRLSVESKFGRRSVPVSQSVACGLVALADGDDVIWKNRFGSPMSAGGLAALLRRLFHRAGISGPDRGPRILRSTFACRYIEAGGSVAAVSRILTGRRWYNPALWFITAKESRRDLEKHPQFSPLASLGFNPI